jgi:hypothetical protein
VSRTFSLSTIFNQTPAFLLQEFFARTAGGTLGLDWEALPKQKTQPILDALTAQPRSVLDGVEAALHDIFDLASAAGQAALIQTSAECGAGNLAAVLPADLGHYGVALWSWLHRPDVFRDATVWHSFDSLSYWRRRTDLVAATPDTSPDALARLGREVSHTFFTMQSRGLNCTVDVFPRSGTYYFCAHTDDYSATEMAHDETKTLVTRVHRATFQVVFAFDAALGSLELFARVPPKVKARLETVFADVVLGQELGEWNPTTSYQLDHLLDRTFPLVTDAADGVRASIRRFRLRPRGSRRSILVSGDPDLGPTDVYDTMDAYLTRMAVQPTAVEVTQATFHIELDERPGRKTGAFSFDVAPPISCGLRNQPQDRIDLGEKYLRHWNVLVDEPSTRTSATAA